MHLLTRLEHIYLGILRVVVIVVATLALGLAILGAVKALPLLLPDKPAAFKAEEVKGAALADFKRKDAAPAPSDQGAENADELGDRADGQVDPALLKAAKNLSARGDTVPPAMIETFLRQHRDELPAEYQSPYSQSVLALSEEVRRDKGAPVDLDQLIQWHFDRFLESANLAEASQAKHETERVAMRVSALQAAALGGGAFLTFLALVFCFLMVKIERNLRVVNTRPVDAA